MTHSPDCAMVLYADIDPRTLKKPLECDGVECDGQEQNDAPGAEYVGDDAIEHIHAKNGHQVHTGPAVTLTGDAARTYKALQTAETQLKAAQKRKDEALRAFLEAVTR